MLEQHIDDQEELPDNSDAIRRKQSEIDKLNKKLANLIEMREDGDIEKEYFRERKKEIESKIGRLAESIKNLTPLPPKDIAGDYSGRLAELKKKLSEYVPSGKQSIKVQQSKNTFAVQHLLRMCRKHQLSKGNAV